jgi:hypothetical protein
MNCKLCNNTKLYEDENMIMECPKCSTGKVLLDFNEDDERIDEIWNNIHPTTLH